MNVNPIADRYASAIFELAAEQNKLDEIGQELKDIAHAIREYPDLARLLHHPLVTPADKIETLLKLAAGATETTRNFLQVVVDKGRQSALPDIAVAYNTKLDARLKRVQAIATTAVNLDDDARSLLQKQLSEYLAQEVSLETRVDPAILGGVVVRVGDRLIDGSIKGRRRELAANLN
jgi:F-type H+-transporting ATPase subunit delta